MIGSGTYVEFREKLPPLQFQAGGKTYKIKSIRQRVAGKETKFEPVDLTKLSKIEQDAFSIAAQKAAAAFPYIDKGLRGSPSFTLTFRQQDPGTLLHTVTYSKTPGGTPVIVKMEDYAEEERTKIQSHFNELTLLIQRVQPKKQGKELIDPLANAIHEVGSKGSKCAALALVYTREPGIDAKTLEIRAKLTLRSARDVITKPDSNFADTTTVEYARLYADAKASNEAAMTRGDADLIPLDNPESLRQAYANKMVKEGELLDSTFFTAQSYPVIILEKILEKGSYRVNMVQNLERSSPELPVSILVYDRENKHYQALIPTEENLEDLKHILPEGLREYPFLPVASESDSD